MKQKISIPDPRSAHTGSRDLSGRDPSDILKFLGLNHPTHKKESKREIYQGIPIEEMGILKEVSGIKKIAISREEGIENSTKYMQTNFSQLERNLDKIKEVFQGKVVVDLGAGENSFGYFLANMAEAKSYVGVDAFNANMLRSSLCKYEKFIKKNEAIPYSVVEADMLSFLENVKDDSISMIASGIDDFIIQDGKYCSKVSKEIQRTMHSGGGLLSVMSSLYLPEKSKITIMENERNRYIGSQIAILKK